MPFSTHCLDVLADDGLFALQTLGSSSLCTLSLTVQAPCISILLNVAHTFLERITTLRAKKVSKMPMLTQCNRVFADDRCLAMLASRSKILVPVEVTEIAESLVAILSHRLAFNFWEFLSTSTSLDSVEALCTIHLRFGAYFEGFESGSAGEADETLRMEAFGGSTKSNYFSFNW